MLSSVGEWQIRIKSGRTYSNRAINTILFWINFRWPVCMYVHSHCTVFILCACLYIFSASLAQPKQFQCIYFERKNVHVLFVLINKKHHPEPGWKTQGSIFIWKQLRLHHCEPPFFGCRTCRLIVYVFIACKCNQRRKKGIENVSSLVWLGHSAAGF